MKKTKLGQTLIKALRQALQAELAYCEQMVKSKHKSPHWAIRVSEIKAVLKRKK